jgi:hypothetical protein
MQTMPYTSDLCIENQTATCANHATLFVSLELSRSKWLVTSLSPGNARGESVRAGRQACEDRLDLRSRA